MARSRERDQDAAVPMISIIGPRMEVVGNCVTEGTLRIEGRVVGNVHAGKAVVIGKDGRVDGDVSTQDAVISGEIVGTIVAASRLEIQASARISGEIRARRLQLAEGAVLNAEVHMGEVELSPPSKERTVRAVDGVEGLSAAGGETGTVLRTHSPQGPRGADAAAVAAR